jgi:hypothetical protein
MAGTINALLVSGSTLFGVWDDTGNAGNLFQIPIAQGPSTAQATVFQTQSMVFSHALTSDTSYL